MMSYALLHNLPLFLSLEIGSVNEIGSRLAASKTQRFSCPCLSRCCSFTVSTWSHQDFYMVSLDLNSGAYGSIETVLTH